MPLNLSAALDGQYEQAVTLTQQAIAADDGKRYAEAMDCYCKGITKFLIVIKGAPTHIGDSIRPRVESYCRRAEAIKTMLAADENSKQPHPQPQPQPQPSPTSDRRHSEQQRTSPTADRLERALALCKVKAARQSAEIGVLTAKVQQLTTDLAAAAPAAGSPAHGVRRPVEHYCAVTAELLKDPVMTTCGCGATMERNAVLQWWGSGNRSCPQCLTELASTVIAPNVALRNIVHSWGRPAVPA
eukprot:m.156059 g.156059  ORF g.156059 m.156059 type:complete len:243 (+) comp23606_c0_seq2:276-1004(+)